MNKAIQAITNRISIAANEKYQRNFKELDIFADSCVCGVSRKVTRIKLAATKGFMFSICVGLIIRTIIHTEVIIVVVI